MLEQDRWNKTVDAIRLDIPKFQLVSKKDSKMQKLLGMILSLVGIKYLNFWTTISPRIYTSEKIENIPFGRWKTIQHEWVHLKDIRKMKWPLFIFLYYSPQLFSLLAILSFFNTWWLLCLLFLLPIPSPGRAWIEFRGYRRSIELGREGKDIIRHFTGPSYYFMWPFPKNVKKNLEKSSPYMKEMDNATK